MNFKKNKKVVYQDLGLVAYEQAQDYQEELFNEIIETKIANRKLLPEERLITPNYLLFCEHPHVYTLGKSGDENNLLVNQAELNGIQAEFHKIGRGGDITYHGPGQLVGYPILDLDNFFTDIHKYLRILEEVVIQTLLEYRIESGRVDGLTGVWIDGATPNARKICAMGIRASRWVTMHGFALNANTSLDYFNHIIPCGINDKKVTSLQKEIGHEVDLIELKEKLLKNFSRQFEMELITQENTTEI